MASNKVALACSVCGNRNYTVNVSQAKRNDRLELMKFCKNCGVQRLHRQTK